MRKLGFVLFVLGAVACSKKKRETAETPAAPVATVDAAAPAPVAQVYTPDGWTRHDLRAWRRPLPVSVALPPNGRVQRATPEDDQPKSWHLDARTNGVVALKLEDGAAETLDAALATAKTRGAVLSSEQTPDGGWILAHAVALTDSVEVYDVLGLRKDLKLRCEARHLTKEMVDRVVQVCRSLAPAEGPAPPVPSKESEELEDAAWSLTEVGAEGASSEGFVAGPVQVTQDGKTQKITTAKQLDKVLFPGGKGALLPEQMKCDDGCCTGTFSDEQRANAKGSVAIEKVCMKPNGDDWALTELTLGRL